GEPGSRFGRHCRLRITYCLGVCSESNRDARSICAVSRGCSGVAGHCRGPCRCHVYPGLAQIQLLEPIWPKEGGCSSQLSREYGAIIPFDSLLIVRNDTIGAACSVVTCPCRMDFIAGDRSGRGLLPIV